MADLPRDPRDPRDHEEPPPAESQPMAQRQGPAQNGRGEAPPPVAPAWDAEDRRRRAILLTRVLFGVLLLALFVVFVSLNSDSVPVHFIFVQTRAPLVWVFVVCALIGALATYLLGRAGRRAARKYIKELERRVEDRDRTR